MQRPHVFALVFSAMLVLVGAASSAQESKTYVGGGLLFSTQSAGQPDGDPDNPKPGIGGSAWGAYFTVGRVLAGSLSLAGEVSIPARFTAAQKLDYFTSALYENQYRDTVISAVLHFHGSATRRIRPDAVVGFSLIEESNLRRTAVQVEAFPRTAQYEPFGRQEEQSAQTLGLTGGLGLEIAVSEHLRIVPQFRVHWIQRPDFGNPLGSLFLGPLLLHSAVGLRAQF